nr:protein detoxification 12 [Quercus suber]
MGQDPTISHEAGKFMIWLIPALFAYGTLQALVRYFQTQSLIIPLLISSCVTLCFHIPLCWVLVYNSRLGHLGAALAIGMSYWLNVILLGLHMKYTSASSKTRVPISMEIFRGIGEFFRFAIPFAIMICLEWWSFELLILLSGLLPNPTLETSVLSVCLSTISTLYMIPDGIAAAARSWESARSAFSCHCSDVYYVDYVTTMAPLVCLSVILDNLHGVLSGIARGCGWQDLGAYVNVGAYYLCGLPIAAILGFWLQMRGQGLWIGILVGASVQALLLSIITSCTNWEKQASKARQRMLEGRSSVENRLT